MTFGKLMDRAPALIPLDLAGIRAALDAMVPAQAKVSRKRWANLRSDLASAIEASGLRPMLKTAGVALDEPWSKLLQRVTDQRVRNGLSRFARWASLRQVEPRAVDTAAIARFIAELEATTLIRNLDSQRRSVAMVWNTSRSPAARCGPADRRGADQPIGADASRLGATAGARSEPTLSAILPGARCPILSINMRGQGRWHHGRCICGATTFIPPSPPPAPPGSTWPTGRRSQAW